MLLQSKLTNACALLLLLGVVWPVEAETPPQFFWAQHAGGGGDDRALAVALDPTGNVLVTGVFSGTAFIGSSNFVSAGLEDIFPGEVRCGRELLVGPPGRRDWR
jgi:hypothetical protein